MTTCLFASRAARFSALAFAIALAGCAGESPSQRATHESLNSVLWMQTSGEYWAACATTYAEARGNLDRALADPGWTAALEQTGDASKLPPAVILDVDETTLDNSVFQARLASTNTFFTPDKFSDWCREEHAGVVPGVAEFCKYAVSKGVTLLFVTNRDAKVSDATLHNFEKAGLPFDPAHVQVIGKSGDSDKGPRRKAICEKYRVVLLVGDQLQDFLTIPKGTSAADRSELAKKNADKWGRQWIALPNPAYGDWERALIDPKATDEENLKRKYEALRK